MDAIDGTHFDIKKPLIIPEDYYYFKSGGISMQCQGVVDCYQCFLNVVVGMCGSCNDVCMLRHLTLYRMVTSTNIFDVAYA